jgi:hypothetical protein
MAGGTISTHLATILLYLHPPLPEFPQCPCSAQLHWSNVAVVSKQEGSAVTQGNKVEAWCMVYDDVVLLVGWLFVRVSCNLRLHRYVVGWLPLYTVII